MSDLVIGSSSKKIDESASNIYSCAEKINSLFNQFDELMESTKGFYNCENAEELRSKYFKVRQNFQIVNDNILNYVEKLMTVKSGFANKNSELTTFIGEQQVEKGNE